MENLAIRYRIQNLLEEKGCIFIRLWLYLRLINYSRYYYNKKKLKHKRIYNFEYEVFHITFTQISEYALTLPIETHLLGSVV